MSTVACPSGETWIAVSRIARSRNGGITPIPDANRISPTVTPSLFLYGLKSLMIRRRFALRTAGSSGRSTGASGARE